MTICIPQHVRGTWLAVWLGAICLAGCSGESPTTPTTPTPPSSPRGERGPAFSVNVSEGGFNYSGTNLSEPPWVSYSPCGDVTNISNQSATWAIEMMVYGPDGSLYATRSRSDPAPHRFLPGAGILGCGLHTGAVDYDSTHAHAVTYRLRVSYTLDDGTTGSVEAEGPMRPSVDAQITGIIINEFRTRGPSGARDQFVELRNVSAEPITMRGWFLQPSHRSDEVAVGHRSDLPEVVTIGAGCSYLLTARGQFSDGTYSGSVPGDAQLRPVLSDAGGFALRTQAGRVIDQVGLSPNTVFKEGTPLEPFGSADTDRSYARIGPDTGDNSRDFRMLGPSTPHNSQGCR